MPIIWVLAAICAFRHYLSVFHYFRFCHYFRFSHYLECHLYQSFCYYLRFHHYLGFGHYFLPLFEASPLFGFWSLFDANEYSKLNLPVLTQNRNVFLISDSICSRDEDFSLARLILSSSFSFKSLGCLNSKTFSSLLLELFK